MSSLSSVLKTCQPMVYYSIYYMYCKSLPEKSFEICGISLKIFVVCKKFEVTRKVHYVSPKIEKRILVQLETPTILGHYKEIWSLACSGCHFQKKVLLLLY